MRPDDDTDASEAFVVACDGCDSTVVVAVGAAPELGVGTDGPKLGAGEVTPFCCCAGDVLSVGRVLSSSSPSEESESLHPGTYPLADMSRRGEGRGGEGRGEGVLSLCMAVVV